MLQLSHIESFWIGVLQGLTEFLPVSSSAHLIIYSHLTCDCPLPLYYNVALHFGTALALLIYFARDWFGMLGGLTMRNHSIQGERKRRLLWNLVAASLPAGFLGFFLKEFIETYLHVVSFLAFPLAIFGFVLWYVDKSRPETKTIHEIHFGEAFLLGLGQSLALIPGVSRSAASVTACRFSGLKKKEAIHFSFLMGTPLMVAASLLHAKDFYMSLGEPQFYIGLFTSFVFGLITIHFFLKFFSRFSFLSFALYRFCLAFFLLYSL